MNSHVWVQVSVNIGQRSLKIQIQRNESIEEVVNRFIGENKLSVRYQSIITNMIKQEIRKRMAREEKVEPVVNNLDQVKSSVSSGLGDPLCNQSALLNKENGLLAEVLKIQSQTNKKREQKLSELRQTSQTKNSVIMTDRSTEEAKQRPSFRKFETIKPSVPFVSQTPKMAIDSSSRQSSAQTFNNHMHINKDRSLQISQYQSQSQFKSSSSLNKKSNQNIIQENQKQLDKEITSDIAELKQLLSYNEVYNSNSSKTNNSNNNISSNRSQQHQSSIWVERKSTQLPKTKRIKTETPQNIYEKWRKLGEEKALQSQSRNKDILKSQPKSKSPLVKREDTFFYNKGKSFLEEKKRKVGSKFNEIYPFKTSKTPVSSKTGIETTNRLFKQSKQYFSKKMVKPKHIDLDLSLKPDPIRQKVRKRDQEHDQIISQLINQGRIKSPAAIVYKEKSPFRKTIVFN